MSKLQRVRFLLINANPYIEDAVMPYGLEILRANLQAQNLEVRIAHPFLASDRPYQVTEQIVKDFRPNIVGISIRNLDDLVIIGDRDRRPNQTRIDINFYLPRIKGVVEAVKRSVTKGTRLILGGSGFTACPEPCMQYLDVDLGVIGPGELVLPKIANGDYYPSGVIYRKGDRFIRIPPKFSFEHVRVNKIAREAGFEYPFTFQASEVNYPIRTKVGCSLRCSYCVEHLNLPSVWLRNPRDVIEELGGIISERDNVSIGFVDSEFNLPQEGHASAILEALIDSRIYKRIKWTAYFSVVPFSARFAKKIASSNCKGVSITVDHCNDRILAGIGKDYKREDIERTFKLTSRYRLRKVWGIIFGLPGEDWKSIKEGVQFVRRYLGQEDAFQYQVGARVYPGTPLARYVRQNKYRNLYGSRDKSFLHPVVYCQPCPPWELNAYLRGEFKDLPNVSLFNTSEDFPSLRDPRLVRLKRYRSRGLYFYSCGDPSRAANWYQKALKIGKDRSYISGILNEASEVYKNLSDYPRAIGCLKRMIRIQKDLRPLDKTTLADIYNNLATLYAAKEDYREAINSLRSALRLNPSLTIARENLQELKKAYQIR